MNTREVNFETTTTAVLDDFDHRFTDMVIQLLKQRNSIKPTSNGKQTATFADIQKGYGLLVLADKDDEQNPFMVTTEFLVPSYELAASFMIMWRRWCDKRSVNSSKGLLSLMGKVSDNMRENTDHDSHQSINNLAIGLMGAVLDNYPEIVNSMRWSVDNGFAPCLVITNENNQAKCGVCYGGKYLTS